MKKVLFSAVAMLGAVLAQEPIDASIQYPFLMWSESRIQGFEEIFTEASSQEIASRVHQTVFGPGEQLEASRVFLLRKDGLTTRDLIRSIQYLQYDHDAITNHSVAYVYVETLGFDNDDEGVLSKSLGVPPTEHSIESADQISALAQSLAADQSTSLKFHVINVKQSLPNEILNTISQEIQEQVKSAGDTSYLMAMAGRQGAAAEFVSLQQVESLTLAAAGPLRAVTPTPQAVKKYLYPNTLSAILVMLFIAFMMIMGFLLLMDVQTPVYFPTEKIDFGKIEK